LAIDQPEWAALNTVPDAIRFSNSVGYPVLVRPSYVLSGNAMNVALNDTQLSKFLAQATSVSPDAPVVVSKFYQGKEVDYDGVADGDGNVICFAVCEHIEMAGVHSGDATLVLPAQNLYVSTVKAVRIVALKLAKALKICGPFNVQFVCDQDRGKVKVIECNLRASRSFPFVSKTFNTNFIEIATRLMMNLPAAHVDINLYDIDYVCVKSPQFSWPRLEGADPVTRVEMASTGEVACFGSTLNKAFLTSLLASNFTLPTGRNVFLNFSVFQVSEFAHAAHNLEMLGFKLFTTKTMQLEFAKYNISVQVLSLPSCSSAETKQTKQTTVLGSLQSGRLHLIINVFHSGESAHASSLQDDNYIIRRAAVDFNVPLLTNLKRAQQLVTSLTESATKDECSILWTAPMLDIKTWHEYLVSARLA
jgi:hypothetical protein